jgi:hypothetical protein
VFRSNSVHALSSETGRLIREDEKPLPFEAWGDATVVVEGRIE